MRVELKLINESIFSELDSKIIFNIKHPRCYGVLANANYSFKFGWQSEIVEPKVIEISENIYSVGIDLNFVIVDFNNGKVLLNIELNYFFYDLKVNDGFIYVISELEIIKINQITFMPIEKFELPDFFEEITFKEKLLEVRCIGGEVVTF